MIGRKMSHGRSSDCEVLGRGYAKMYLNDVNQNLLLYFKICFLVWLGPNSWSPFVFYVFFSIDQIMQEKLRFNIYTLSDVQVYSSVFFIENSKLLLGQKWKLLILAARIGIVMEWDVSHFIRLKQISAFLLLFSLIYYILEMDFSWSFAFWSGASHFRISCLF